MNYPQYIINLEKILEKIKTLKEEEFDFSDYVSRCNKKKCGTVCCVVGWFPKWFPKSGFTWKERQLIEPDEYDSVTEALIDIIGIPRKWIDCLFMGHVNPIPELPRTYLHSTLSEVIDVWEKSIEYLKENPIIPLYYIE